MTRTPTWLPNDRVTVTITGVSMRPPEGISGPVGSGIGYLDDGTRVVVADGARYLGREVHLVITRVLRTAADLALFGRRVDPDGLVPAYVAPGGGGEGGGPRRGRNGEHLCATRQAPSIV